MEFDEEVDGFLVEDSEAVLDEVGLYATTSLWTDLMTTQTLEALDVIKGLPEFSALDADIQVICDKLKVSRLWSHQSCFHWG